ncbi:chitinase [Cellulomonas sp. URHD0024]|uniref:chitinase n=1 Tax=Cellulomonas sp. URHD0024 TaxID=1302620 RepID=UPI0004803CB0|nr:chitinase [Cellulomonas sp. URHD0024]
MRRPRARIAGVLAAVVVAGGLTLATGISADAAANSGPGLPAHFAAPYVEMWNSPSAIANARAATGAKYFTLAFIINGNGSCNATINGGTAVDDAGWIGAINTLRSAGGDVIASFGGASGIEIGVACTSVDTLKAQYRKVIDAMNLTAIDLDIEGGALGNTTANDRRNQALAQLQTEYRAAGKTLGVHYTLPIDPGGLPSEAVALLQNAKSRGVDVTVVNPMTMDYGPAMDMGQAAISAANALYGQLAGIWPAKTSAQLWNMQGSTPMIGVNDTTAEVFTTQDATELTDFAISKGMRLLAFWALGRDAQCSGSVAQPADNCSGTSQSRYQFTSTFNRLTGSTSTPPPTTTPPPTGRTGLVRGVASNRCLDVVDGGTADGTAIQLWDCASGNANQAWTVGTDGTLRARGKCLDVAAASTVNGAKVQLYTCNGTPAQKWTANADGTMRALGKCLDATGQATANGTRLQTWDCFASGNQRWTLP